MPDISFDERYMGYYDENGNWVTPDDPRDEEGYEEYHEFHERGKFQNRRWRSENQSWVFKNETLPIIIVSVLVYYFLL